MAIGRSPVSMANKDMNNHCHRMPNASLLAVLLWGNNIGLVRWSWYLKCFFERVGAHEK
jgi:hypothetical protein